MLSLSVPRSGRSLSPAPSRLTPTGMTRSHTEKDSMRERSFSVSPRGSIPICPQLTPSQVAVIRKSWKHVNTKGLIAVLTRCFQRLESSCPVASLCFSGTSHSLVAPSSEQQVRSVADHAKYLLNMMDRIIDGEQDLEEMREVGARHVCLKQDFGFSSPELDRFQEIFVEVMLKQDGIQHSKETSRAWRLLICSMVDVFRDGFDQQLRQFKRKHSFNAHTQYFENMERRASSVHPSRKASLNTDPRLAQMTRKLSQL